MTFLFFKFQAKCFTPTPEETEAYIAAARELSLQEDKDGQAKESTGALSQASVVVDRSPSKQLIDRKGKKKQEEGRAKQDRRRGKRGKRSGKKMNDSTSRLEKVICS